MAYFTYNNKTGQLIEISEELLHNGCPPTNLAVSYTQLTITEIETLYYWDAELRDFLPKN